MNDKIEWHEFSSGAELARAFAERISGLLSAAVSARGSASIAVSGGTTPVAFFAALSRMAIEWEHVTVTLVDERFVPASSERSNERLVTQNLLQNEAARAGFVGLYCEADAVEDAAWRASEDIQRLALPLDAAVMGMGTDQHTASFFPDADGIDALLAARDGPCVLPITAPSAREPRLTLSMPVLAEARFHALHIEGSDKRAALEAALEGDGSVRSPIRALIDRAATPFHIYWAPKEEAGNDREN